MDVRQEPGRLRRAGVHPAASDAVDVEQLYAAHRLSLVRLALLLVGDARVAEDVVQSIFVTVNRRGGRRIDPATALSQLRGAVVRACRGAVPPASGGHTEGLDALTDAGPGVGVDPREDILGALQRLPRREREVLVLRHLAQLSNRQVAQVLGVEADKVAFLSGQALGVVARTVHPAVAGDLEQRVWHAMNARAERLEASDLTTSFGDVLTADAHLTRRRRRQWLGAVAGVLVVTVAAGTTVTTRRGQPTPPTPVASSVMAIPPPSHDDGAAPRPEIPWGHVGSGWTVALTTTSPKAAAWTLYLVSPEGLRYAVGTTPSQTTVQDVSPDGRTVLLGVAGEPYVWDLVAGTSRRLPAPYGWMAVRYANTDDHAYLVIWTDDAYHVGLERRTANGDLLVAYPVRLQARPGAQATPTVLVSHDGARLVVSSTQGLQVLDASSSALRSVLAPPSYTGCGPTSLWTGDRVLLTCGTDPPDIFVSALDDTPPTPLVSSRVASPAAALGVVRAWPWSEGVLVQEGDECSNDLAVLTADGSRSTLHPRAPQLGSFVANTVVGDELILGGTRCASDGPELLAYDLATGEVTNLLGGDRRGGTVLHAVVIDPAR